MDIVSMLVDAGATVITTRKRHNTTYVEVAWEDAVPMKFEICAFDDSERNSAIHRQVTAALIMECRESRKAKFESAAKAHTDGGTEVSSANGDDAQRSSQGGDAASAG